jgi:hypothetical protein
MSLEENQDRHRKNIQRRMRKPLHKIQKGLQQHRPTDPKEIGEEPFTKRGANNDPRNEGMSRATPEMQECMHFLSNSIGKDESTLKQELDQFPHRDKLKQLLGHMMSASLGGWKDNGLYLVNESGNCASKRHWDIKDGKLILKDNQTKPNFDIDKLWRIRSLI